MAVEHLAISVGAKWFWSNLEFLSAPHAKYCVDGELPEYTIFSDTTTSFAAVERYFNDPTVASLAGEYNSLRSLAARLECLAMRASAVNVYHRYTEPLWRDLEGKDWPPDKMSTSEIEYDGATRLQYRMPSYRRNFVCYYVTETGWAASGRHAELQVSLKIICTNHEDACQSLCERSLEQTVCHHWRAGQCMAYFASWRTRISPNCSHYAGVRGMTDLRFHD